MNDNQLKLEKALSGTPDNVRSSLIYGRRLSECSTFKIGGKADCVAYPRNEEELTAVCNAARQAGIPVFVAGNASNILFDDEGYRGLVLFTSAMRSAECRGDRIYAQCGASLTSVSVLASKNSLSGLEFLYGIPGTVGGGIYMNCGAFEGQIADVLTCSRYYDPDTGDIVTLDASEHEFSYRNSCYKEKNKIIISAEFKGTPCTDDIRSVMDSYMKKRTDSQPLDMPNAGSVFKRYPGYYTSRLIEEAGLKGRSVGGAQVSLKHAGFIVNTGNATAGDVKELIEIIKEEIYRINGIHIECEIIFAPKE